MHKYYCTKCDHVCGKSEDIGDTDSCVQTNGMWTMKDGEDYETQIEIVQSCDACGYQVYTLEDLTKFRDSVMKGIALLEKEV